MKKQQKQSSLQRLSAVLEQHDLSFYRASKLMDPSSYQLGTPEGETIRINLQDLDLLDDKGELTAAAKTAIDAIEALFKPTASKKAAVTIDLEKVRQYREIFPNITLGTGKRARSSEKDLVGYFLRFFKHYPEYENKWELIFKATELYVEEFSRKNYDFMRTAAYYIIKQANDRSHSSDLADYCERVLSGDDENKPQFKIKVI